MFILSWLKQNFVIVYLKCSWLEHQFFFGAETINMPSVDRLDCTRFGLQDGGRVSCWLNWDVIFDFLNGFVDLWMPSILIILSSVVDTCENRKVSRKIRG